MSCRYDTKVCFDAGSRENHLLDLNFKIVLEIFYTFVSGISFSSTLLLAVWG